MSPGVVVVTKVCRPGSDAYKSYVDYIDRENAKNKNGSKWNLYQDYMGNPEKSTGLFTAQQDFLSVTQKDALKKVFEKARENDSLMWQTVISFDNKWLAENNLYDMQEHTLDEKRLKEITRNAVAKMLKKEDLENAVWSAAVHYNTDNIHIHIATVEPVPQRRKKEFLVNGEKGPVIQEEYVGRFKYQSIEACKSTVVNEILQTREVNYQINHIIRDRIVADKRQRALHRDPELQGRFLKLYESMPACDRKMWNYNNQIMADRREQIDQLSRRFIDIYRQEDFRDLEEIIRRQSEAYERAYGKSDTKYEEGKINDLYMRLGNVILKEIREYDRMVRGTDEGADGRRSRELPASGQTSASGQMSEAGSRGKILYVMRKLNSSMKDTYEKYVNERIHEALLQGKSLEEISLPSRE